MDNYRTPYQAAESEVVEKRSRFIGQVWPVSDEAEARQRIEAARKRFRDARHNCWCFLLRSGTVRYSDDGEPQGTAGLPMLNVFQQQEVTNACCVVTRYFGGILLGTGGLTRVYSRAARDALSAAGIAVAQRWTLWTVPCPYPLFERVKLEIETFGGMVQDTAYGADVRIQAAFPTGQAEPFADRLAELSAGKLSMSPRGEAFLSGPRENPIP